MRVSKFVVLIVVTFLLAGCFSPVEFGSGTEIPDLPPTNKVLVVLNAPPEGATPIGNDGEPIPPKEPELPDGPDHLDPPREHAMYITDWQREVLIGSNTERITLSLENDYTNTRFYIAFLAYRPYEELEYIATSELYFAPAYWLGTMTFDVPLGDYHRVFGVQVWTGGTDDSPDFLPRTMIAFVPPCPTEYDWPEPYSYEWCEYHYH